MLPVLVEFNYSTPAGMFPDAVPSLPYVWNDALNVEFESGLVKASGDRALGLGISTFPVRGMGALRTNAGLQELYFGTLTNVYRSVALASPASIGSGFSTQQHQAVSAMAGHWKFAPWGEWIIYSNGANPLQVRKGTGSGSNLLQGGTDPLPFASAKLLGRLGPHVIAANIPNGPTEIRWCSDDDVEDWVVTAVNTAGDFVIRDATSELRAMVPLGERLALYTSEQMYVMTYIGAPFVFGVQPLLNGIGAWGPSSVAAVGRENYGWGPSGFWRTDGTQFTHIDGGGLEGRPSAVREWIRTQLYVGQASKIVCYHNEVRHRVEWFYPTADASENSQGIAYDYLTKGWSRINHSYTAALERDVFQYALGAAGSVGIYAENTGTPSSASLTTKALLADYPTYGKFVSQVRVMHTGTVTCEVGYSLTVNGTITWLAGVVFSGAWAVYELNRSVMFLWVRFSGNGPWKIAGFQVYGRSSGRRL